MTNYSQYTNSPDSLTLDMATTLGLISPANITSFGSDFGYLRIDLTDGETSAAMYLLGFDLAITGEPGNYVFSGTVSTLYFVLPGLDLSNRSVSIQYTSTALTDIFADPTIMFAGNDYITGQLGPNALYGYGGDDTLIGGFNAPGQTAQDTLYGGAGNDTFYVTEIGEEDNSNPVIFGGTGRDRLDVSWSILGPLAVVESGRMTDTPIGIEVLSFSYSNYQYPDGYTYLNAKITALPGAGLLAIETLQEIIDLQQITATGAGLIDLSGVAINDSNDTPISGDEVFRYFGTDGDDGFLAPESFGAATDIAYFGYGGDDTLGASASAIETLLGGAGDDTYLLAPSAFTFGARDVIIEDALGGVDTVISTSSTSLEDFAHVEHLTLIGTGDINGTGNAGNNRITGNAGDNILHGGFGGLDTLRGGAGDDTYYLTSGVTIVEAANAGIDTLIADATATLATNVDELRLTGSAAINGTGNGLANRMTGNNGANQLTGAGGDDTLAGGSGADTLVADGGNDRLTGGDGKDQQTGGAGDDVFDFNKVSETATGAATADVISDFVRGRDTIDLAGIDAFAGGANNAFAFRGTEAFSSTTKGEVRFKTFDQTGTENDYTMVYIDTDGDTGVEMAIRLTGLYALSAADFVL